MKRCLALILALMLLLGCSPALADETLRMTMTFSASEEETTSLMQALGLDNALLHKGFSELVSNLRLDGALGLGEEKHAAEWKISLKTRTLLSVAMWLTGEEAVEQLSLMPGVELHMLIPELESGPAATTGLPILDANAVLTKVSPLTEEWRGSLNCTQERGSFAGDAYSGGTFRRTWLFDDRDLAVLTDALLNDKDDPLAELLIYGAALAEAAGGEVNTEEKLREELREENRKSAWNNEYSYRWSEVSRLDTEGELQIIGHSFTAFKDGEPLATLSIGRGAGSIQAVLGLGLEAYNFYVSLTAEVVGDENGNAGLNGLSCRVVTDDLGVGYAAAKDDPAFWVFDGQLRLTREDDKLRWETYALFPAFSLSAFAQSLGIPLNVSLDAEVRGEGLYSLETQQITAEEHLYLDDSDAPCFHVMLEGGPSAEPIRFQENLRRLHMDEQLSDEEEDLLYQALNQGSSQLMTNLLMTLPPELMGYLTQLLNQ